ncbi:hypothetical protein C1O63_1293 [Dehalococcoides mccartyi]|nr:hypothetical protein C1O63_1293 [Dehalococcoides mccartyi]
MTDYIPNNISGLYHSLAEGKLLILSSPSFWTKRGIRL